MLARLDKIPGVERSESDRAGTLIRVSVVAAATSDQVAKQVFQALAAEKRKPEPLLGDELRQVLTREKWHGPDELSEIEFRTLSQRQVQAFAEAERLDSGTTDKLATIAEEEWDRLAEAVDADTTARTDWAARCDEFAAAFVDRAKGLLTAEQLERLQQANTQRQELLKQELIRLSEGEECEPTSK